MTYQLLNTSAHDTGLPAESVDCIVSSPPYFGLRAYSGDQGIDWPEVQYVPMPGLPLLTIPAMHCGLGEETDPNAYIGHLILVMREMWRVLKTTGTVWWNLGDSYNGSGGAGGDYGVGGLKEGQPKYPGRKVGTLKAKDLIMIPARFALAAQADGWWVRSDIIWAKPNPMPESVTDRPTKAHEYIYLLTKAEKYYYDAEAIREAATHAGQTVKLGDKSFSKGQANGAGIKPTGNGLCSEYVVSNGRNKRSVWNIATTPFAAAHYAVFPMAIPETCIKAGSSAHGVCPACGKPWTRVVERVANYEKRQYRGEPNGKPPQVDSSGWRPPTITAAGWEPTCTCDAGEPIPATILDPFNGSGTTGRAALKLGRSYIGVDVSAEYLTELAPERMSNVQMEMAL